MVRLKNIVEGTCFGAFALANLVVASSSLFPEVYSKIPQLREYFVNQPVDLSEGFLSSVLGGVCLYLSGTSFFSDTN